MGETVTDDGVTYENFEVQWSGDFSSWTTLDSIRGPIGGGGDFGVSVDLLSSDPDAPQFYRVRDTEMRALAYDGGEEVFGFGRTLKRAMESIGFMSIEAFRESVPDAGYLESLSFNPDDAEFYEELEEIQLNHTLGAILKGILRLIEWKPSIFPGW